MNYYIVVKKDTELQVANKNDGKMVKRLKKYAELLGETVFQKQKD